MIRKELFQDAFVLAKSAKSDPANPVVVWQERKFLDEGDNGKMEIRYLVGTRWQMFQNMVEANKTINGGFYEIVGGPCHFFIEVMGDTSAVVMAAIEAFGQILGCVMRQTSVYWEYKSVVKGENSPDGFVAHVTWRFYSDGGELVVLSSVSDAGKLFEAAMQKAQHMTPFLEARRLSLQQLKQLINPIYQNGITTLRLCGSGRIDVELSGKVLEKKRLMPLNGKFDFDVFMCHLASYYPAGLPTVTLDVSKIKPS